MRCGRAVHVGSVVTIVCVIHLCTIVVLYMQCVQNHERFAGLARISFFAASVTLDAMARLLLVLRRLWRCAVLCLPLACMTSHTIEDRLMAAAAV